MIVSYTLLFWTVRSNKFYLEHSYAGVGVLNGRDTAIRILRLERLFLQI